MKWVADRGILQDKIPSTPASAKLAVIPITLRLEPSHRIKVLFIGAKIGPSNEMPET